MKSSETGQIVPFLDVFSLKSHDEGRFLNKAAKIPEIEQLTNFWVSLYIMTPWLLA